MGVSPISLKKKRCSKHFKPMDRSAGSRRRSLANLYGKEKKKKKIVLFEKIKRQHTNLIKDEDPYRPCCSGYFCLQ